MFIFGGCRGVGDVYSVEVDEVEAEDVDAGEAAAGVLVGGGRGAEDSRVEGLEGGEEGIIIVN